MRRRWLAIAAAALAMTTGIATAAKAAPVSGTPQVQVCITNLSPHDCMNRAGGGTGIGNPVIDYTLNDQNNDFSFFPDYRVCNGTGWVHNGENGLVCPFRFGSGLNARYDGNAAFTLEAYNEAYYASVSDHTYGYVTLQDLSSSGDNSTWILSRYGYLVSVGESNWHWDQYGTYDYPEWLWSGGYRTQLLARESATDIWGCVGTGIGNC